MPHRDDDDDAERRRLDRLIYEGQSIPLEGQTRFPPVTPAPNGTSLLKQWANAIGVVGIPGAIAIFLVYIGATEIPKLSRGVEQAIAESKQTRAILEHQIQQTQRLIEIAQRTCASVSALAKTEEAKEIARESCYGRGR